MNIDNLSFSRHLPEILDAISTSAAVSIDLELTGITRNAAPAAPADVGPETVQTLQERYASMRAAAKMYGIIQAGITVVQSLDADAARLRTWNFDLSPTSTKRIHALGIERDVTFQSSAIQFLADSGFDMARPFVNGVRYLSRDEAAAALAEAENRNEQMQKPRPFAGENESDSSLSGHAAGFLDDVLSEVKAHESDLRKGAVLHITPQATPLTGYQRRLLNRTLDQKHPAFFALGQRDDGPGLTIRLRRGRDPGEYRQMVAARNLVENTTEIRWQTGFRWIIEALCRRGGRLNELEPRLCADMAYSAKELAMIEGAVERLATRPHPVAIVGHNVLCDLTYICQWFLFPLPLEADDFRVQVNKEFPLALDTKFVATSDWIPQEMRPESSLQTVHGKLESDSKADIDIQEDFQDLFHKANLHQAGYDSYLCACALLYHCDALNIDAKDQSKPGRECVGDGANDSPERVAAISDKHLQALDGSWNRLRVFGSGRSGILDLDPSRQMDPDPNPTGRLARRLDLTFTKEKPAGRGNSGNKKSRDSYCKEPRSQW